jgi:PAS domain S-box-containing protein
MRSIFWVLSLPCQQPPLLTGEIDRLAELQRLQLLDSLPEPSFDAITQLAATIREAPIALVSLVDTDRQWFKSRIGLGATETPREDAFCAHAIQTPGELMVVEDALRDARFQQNPLVLGDPYIRFYAGAPIVTPQGHAMGTVCVIDRRPRQLSEMQLNTLRSLSVLVSHLLTSGSEQRQEAARAARAHAQRARMLESLINSGGDMKSFVDQDYTYQVVNPTYLSYWNHQPDDILGKRVPDLVGEGRFNNVLKPLLDRAIAGEVVEYQVEFDFPGQGKHMVDVIYSPAYGVDNECIGAVVRVRDIHELKLREDRLRETAEMLERKSIEQERFIHIVAHDLRETINSINNFSGLLASDESITWPGQSRRYLDHVRAGGQRMETMLGDLLEFMHLDHAALQPKLVDLHQLVHQVQDDLAFALERSSGKILVDTLPRVWGDTTLLRVVLQNLVSNALKFVRTGVPPEIHITHHTDHAAHYLKVHDNDIGIGIGVAPDKLDTVFAMFRRLHTKKQYVGTGLGLSICRRIAELHGAASASRPHPARAAALRCAYHLNPPYPRSRHEPLRTLHPGR